MDGAHAAGSISMSPHRHVLSSASSGAVGAPSHKHTPGSGTAHTGGAPPLDEVPSVAPVEESDGPVLVSIGASMVEAIVVSAIVSIVSSPVVLKPEAGPDDVSEPLALVPSSPEVVVTLMVVGPQPMNAAARAARYRRAVFMGRTLPPVPASLPGQRLDAWCTL